ncbi:8789_t:CDS:2, partial [Ambispora leptoticha]
DGRADCIANQDGERQIPTVVAFSGDEEFTGSQAKAQLLRNSKNTITQFRNLIGKSYQEIVSTDNIITNDAAPLVEKDGEPAYMVTYKDQETTFTVSEILTKYITLLGESAAHFLGQNVMGVVLAVPTYFTELQCEALKKATENAGLPVLQLIHEPVAAALAYQLGEKSSPSRPSSSQETNTLNNSPTVLSATGNDTTALIVDLGSESLDVTIISVRSGIYTIMGSIHDPSLGGVAFDQLLVTHFANEFKRKSKIDISNNQRALAKLRTSVEYTKKTLSSSLNAPCSVESLADGVDFHGTINRTRFEIMASKLFTRCLNVIRDTLKENSLEHYSIDEVILVGGACRIPKLQTKLREIFTNPGTHIRLDLEPDEVVAYGCAYQGALISDLKIKGYQIQDIINDREITNVPHLTKAIGILNAHEQFVTIVKENTPLPARRVVQFSNVELAQKEVYVAVWEGSPQQVKTEEDENKNEDEKVEAIINKAEILESKDDDPSSSVVLETPKIVPEKLLAEMVLSELKPSSKIGDMQIELVLEIDINKKCTIVLSENKSNKSVEVEIPPAVAVES